MSESRAWTRRAVLQRLASGAALAPFVPLLAGDVEAQATARKRLIVFFHPNGYGMAEKYFPTGSETDFTLSEILKPLEPHKADLLVFKGINNPAGPDSGNNVHIPHMGSILTGTPIQRGANTPFFEGDYQYGWANGVSVDQYIAQQLAKGPERTRFASLDFHCVGNRDVVKTQTRMSYTAPAQPVVPEMDPQAALKRLLATNTSDGGAMATALMRAQKERRSVLDFLLGDLARLSARVGADDRPRVEAHLTALRELEQRLTTSPTNAASEAVCQTFTIPAFKSLQGPDTYRERGKAFLDLIVRSMACDAARVFGLQWSNTGGAGGVTFSWLGQSNDEHLASHTPDQDVVATKVFYMEQLAYLVAALKKVPEGSGTMFDSTLILVLSEHGSGASHDNASIPFLLVGSAGGALQTGRYLQYKGVPQNQLLVSVCRSMGVMVDSFGSSKYASGPLAGLSR